MTLHGVGLDGTDRSSCERDFIWIDTPPQDFIQTQKLVLPKVQSSTLSSGSFMVKIPWVLHGVPIHVLALDSFGKYCSFEQALSDVQTDKTTPNIVWLTMLVVVWKQMQQLPTMLEPAVHCGNDTTHKTLETMIV